MDGATYTTVADALKRDYLPTLHAQVEKKCQTHDLFMKTQKGCKGRDIYLKMFKDFPQGVGAAAAGENLPTPTPAGYKEAKIQSKRNYGTIQFDAMLEADDTGIVDIIDFEMKALTESFQKELNFQLAFGDGTGKRSQVASIASQVITLDAPVGQETAFLYPNMVIDITTSGGTEHAGDIVISSVDVANKQITVVGNITAVVDDDEIFRANQRNLVMMGIPGIVKATGVLQTVDPATDTWWKAYEKPKANKWGTDAADFLDSIQETIDEIELNSIGEIDLIYAWPLFMRQYVSVLEAKRQIVNTLEFKAGRKGIAYVNADRQVAILRDKYLPFFYVYFLDTDKLAIHSLKGMHWEEKGGGILKILNLQDVYTAWLKYYAEFATTTRNAHGYWSACGTTVGDYT